MEDNGFGAPDHANGKLTFESPQNQSAFNQDYN